MERNTDDRIIVLDRVMFDRLVGLANVGAFECSGSTKEILHHARRFNPHYGAEVAREREADEAYDRANRQAARDLLSRKTGKMVYIRDGNECFVPCILRGPGHSKTTVRVEDKGKSAQHYQNGIRDVFIGNLAEAVPDGLVLIQRGYWRGSYMQPKFEGP